MINFSIVTVVKNDLAGLRKTRLALENQTYIHWKHIIIDSASTDGTLEFLQELPTTNTIFTSEQDSGIYCAMNKGWRCAEENSFVLFLNANDTFAFENSLTIAAKSFLENPQSDWGATVHEEISRDGKHWVSKLVSPVSISNQLYAFGYRSHQSVVMRASFIKTLKGFNETYQFAADWDLIVRGILLSKPIEWWHALGRFELGGYSSKYILESHLELKMLRKIYLPQTIRRKFFEAVWETIYLRNMGYKSFLTFWLNFIVKLIDRFKSVLFNFLSFFNFSRSQTSKTPTKSFWTKLIEVTHFNLEIEPYYGELTGTYEKN